MNQRKKKMINRYIKTQNSSFILIVLPNIGYSAGILKVGLFL